MSRKDWNQVGLITVIVLVIALVCVVAVRSWVMDWDENLLRGVSCFAVFAIVLGWPAWFYFGYLLGDREGTATIKGIDRGVDKVIKAADRTADVRTMAAVRARQVLSDAIPPPPPLQLPQPTYGQIKSVNGQEVIDL